jgi:ABC-2 type transport system ATP-binding protein
VPESDLVAVEALAVRRGRFTLEVPRWTVAPGQVVGVVGPNGAGKTTLLESLAGLRPVDGGTVRVLSLDPWRRPVEVRSSLGFMSDDLPVFPMRIGRLLRFVSGYYPTWDPKLVERLLERFRLDPGEKTHQLSRGQGTRLRLVLAMAFRPRVLVLDEPAAGLDLGGRRALLDTVLEIAGDPERSVIISSHQLSDIERVADRLLVLSRGRVTHEGPTHDLIGDGRTIEEALLAWEAV